MRQKGYDVCANMRGVPMCTHMHTHRLMQVRFCRHIHPHPPSSGPAHPVLGTSAEDLDRVYTNLWPIILPRSSGLLCDNAAYKGRRVLLGCHKSVRSYSIPLYDATGAWYANFYNTKRRYHKVHHSTL